METGDQLERQVRAARNQSLFRDVNERLQGLADAFQHIAETGSFACECADTSCIDQMNLTLSEYEALRAVPNRFAVRPGHVYPDVEQVVAENERFTVVEKIEAAAREATASDPRSSS